MGIYLLLLPGTGPVAVGGGAPLVGAPPVLVRP